MMDEYLNDGGLVFDLLNPVCAGNWFADRNEWPEPYTVIRPFLFLLNSSVLISLDRNYLVRNKLIIRFA